MQDVIIIQRGQVFISKKGETELLIIDKIINISYIFFPPGKKFKS